MRSIRMPKTMFLCSESGRDQATATRMAEENANVERNGQTFGLMRMLIIEEFNCGLLGSNTIKKSPKGRKLVIRLDKSFNLRYKKTCGNHSCTR